MMCEADRQTDLTSSAGQVGGRIRCRGSRLRRGLMKLRSGTFSAMYNTGLAKFLAARRYRGTHYVVLAYHGVSEHAQALFTSKDLFERHLQFFKNWGKVATLDELGGCAGEQQARPMPGLRFVITFDDGYANVVRNAVPLLRKYGVKAIVYVNPGWIERAVIPWWFQLTGSSARAQELRCLANEKCQFQQRPTVIDDSVSWPAALIKAILTQVPQEQMDAWWSSIESQYALSGESQLGCFRLATWTELASAGDVLEVGSHTQTHCILGLCRDPEFARLQISTAKQAIEARLGKACRHFAYPRGETGDYNGQTRQMLAAAGHQTAVTCCVGAARAGEDPLAIPRFFVSETPVAELAAQLAGFAAQWDNAVQTIKDRVKR